MDNAANFWFLCFSSESAKSRLIDKGFLSDLKPGETPLNNETMGSKSSRDGISARAKSIWLLSASSRIRQISWWLFHSYFPSCLPLISAHGTAWSSPSVNFIGAVTFSLWLAASFSGLIGQLVCSGLLVQPAASSIAITAIIMAATPLYFISFFLPILHYIDGFKDIPFGFDRKILDLCPHLLERCARRAWNWSGRIQK